MADPQHQDEAAVGQDHAALVEGSIGDGHDLNDEQQRHSQEPHGSSEVERERSSHTRRLSSGSGSGSGSGPGMASLHGRMEYSPKITRVDLARRASNSSLRSVDSTSTGRSRSGLDLTSAHPARKNSLALKGGRREEVESLLPQGHQGDEELTNLALTILDNQRENTEDVKNLKLLGELRKTQQYFKDHVDRTNAEREKFIEVISQLEERIHMLEEEKEEAWNTVDAKEEEISNFAQHLGYDDLGSLSSELDRLRSRSDSLTVTHNALQEALEREEEQLSEFTKLKDKNDALACEKVRNIQKLREASRVKKDNEKMALELNALSERNSQYAAMLESDKKEIQELNSTVVSQTREIEHLKEQLSDSLSHEQTSHKFKDQLQGEIGRLREECMKSEAKIEELRGASARVVALEGELGKVRSGLNQKEEAVLKLQEELDRVSGEKEVMKEELSGSVSEYQQSLQKSHELEKEVTRLRQLLDGERAEKDELQKQHRKDLNTHKEELLSLQVEVKRVEDMTRENSSLKTENDNLKMALKSSEEAWETLENEKEQMEQQLLTACDTAHQENARMKALLKSKDVELEALKVELTTVNEERDFLRSELAKTDVLSQYLDNTKDTLRRSSQTSLNAKSPSGRPSMSRRSQSMRVQVSRPAWDSSTS